MPIRRISSATGMPISTCFTAAVICSTEYRFRFIGKTPLSVIVPELTSALCQFFGGRSARGGPDDRCAEADGGGSAGSGFLTTYTYSINATGPLTAVNQGGQARTYQQDELGRTVSETNPESGTTAYTFDSATDAVCGGTSTSPGDLILTTDAAGMKTCVSYDLLHRA